MGSESPVYGTQALCRKEMAFWSAGPKCGNHFHAAESGRRCEEMPRRYQCAVLAPQAIWTAVWFV